MNWLWFSLVIIVCYLIGNVNFARVIARVFKHEDITTKGSGKAIWAIISKTGRYTAPAASPRQAATVIAASASPLPQKL